MITEIVKGADDEIEFKGFKGRYFYRLLWLIGIVFGITFFIYAIGFNSLFIFVISAVLGLLGVMYIRHEAEMNQKFGHIHKSHSPPKAIIQNQQFYKFIKK